MKFKSLHELTAKVKALDTPLYEKHTDVIDLEGIYTELAEIINFQLQNASLIPQKFQDLYLYINGTNCYVACHWYNAKENEISEIHGYSVVNFDGFLADTMEEDIEFYFIIMDAFAKYKSKSIHPLGTVKVYESDEGDETLLVNL